MEQPHAHIICRQALCWMNNKKCRLCGSQARARQGQGQHSAALPTLVVAPSLRARRKVLACRDWARWVRVRGVRGVACARACAQHTPSSTTPRAHTHRASASASKRQCVWPSWAISTTTHVHRNTLQSAQDSHSNPRTAPACWLYKASGRAKGWLGGLCSTSILSRHRGVSGTCRRARPHKSAARGQVDARGVPPGPCALGGHGHCEIYKGGLASTLLYPRGTSMNSSTGAAGVS